MHGRLLAVWLLFTSTAAAEEPTPITLADYVSHVLQSSDAAQDVIDSLLLSDYDLQNVQANYDFQYVPIANLGVTNGTGTQSVGMEVRRKTNLGPTVSIGTRADKVESDQYDIINSHRSSAYVRMSLGLFRSWGKKYNNLDLDLASIAERQAKIRAEKSLRDLIAEAVELYYRTVLANSLLNTAKARVESDTAHLEAARDRLSAGLVSNADLHRSELALLDSEAAKQSRQREYQRALEQFHELLAEHDVQSYRPLAGLRELDPVYPDAWEQKAFELRADWRAQALEGDKADIGLYRAQRDTLPDVSLNVTLGRRGLGDSFSEASTLSESDQSILLQLNSELNGRKQRLNLDREQVRQRQLERKTEQLRRQIKREIRDAAQDLDSERQRQMIAVKREEAAEQALEAANIRYERGLENNLAVLDAEQALAAARVDRDSSLAAYNVAAVRLARNIGILNVDWLILAGADERPRTAGQGARQGSGS